MEGIDLKTTNNESMLVEASGYSYPQVTRELLSGPHNWTYEELKEALKHAEEGVKDPIFAPDEEYKEICTLINGKLQPYRDLHERCDWLLHEDQATEQFTNQNVEVKVQQFGLIDGETTYTLGIPLKSVLFHKK